MDTADLIARIDSFIEAHAGIAADYDPAYDEPGDRFSGPDSAMLYTAARQLEAGLPVSRVHSTYDSGCYHPYSDVAAKATHDALIADIRALIAQQGA